MEQVDANLPCHMEEHRRTCKPDARTCIRCEEPLDEHEDELCMGCAIQQRENPDMVVTYNQLTEKKKEVARACLCMKVRGITKENVEEFIDQNTDRDTPLQFRVTGIFLC